MSGFTSPQRTRWTQRIRFFLIVGFVSFVSIVVSQRWVLAQMANGPAAAGYKREPGTPSSTMPRALREIGFDQNLDQPIPLDVMFRDEGGRDVRIGDYFGRRPVVLVFAYYDCPMLCRQVLNGLASPLSVLSL